MEDLFTIFLFFIFYGIRNLRMGGGAVIIVDLFLALCLKGVRKKTRLFRGHVPYQGGVDPPSR